MLLIPPRQTGTDVISETQNKAGFTSGGGYFFATYMVDVKSAVVQFDADGKKIHEVKLPTAGTVSGFHAFKNQTELFYNFTSFTYPNSIYHYDIKNGKSEFFNKPAVLFNPEDYNTEQVFYTSHDGTKIPMYIIYKKGISLNGNNPTYLYGYGGFDVSLMPIFSPTQDGMAGKRRHICTTQYPRGWRIRREMAFCRNPHAKAKCI